MVGHLAADAAIAPPALDLLATPAHTLHCRGWRRPRILVSASTLADLSGDELRAALAHEVAHIAHRDVPRAWLLLLLRALQWFNPVAQAVGRRIAQELEWHADDRARAITAAPLALAHALVRCARHRVDRFLGLSGHGRLRALEERCRRLMAPAPPLETAPRAHVLVLWLGLTTLLVLVR
jgi:Zn-dependent protease with chaperone function